MKTLDHPADEARALELLRALSNPVRLRIVRELAVRGECVVGELLPGLPVAQPTLSEHLKVLREAGVVRGTVEGPSRCYCINPEAITALRAFLGTMGPGCC